ncbi:hypothetical protein E2C01_046042 [Portunus trituberculatus]|uniref:Uncharacterized protein n=1 Tax=Portunus trituberculatus TaxID=210409 RepID=A0A5B7FWR7_PORTR|nr:hypothetical protein [Portunus trituberculatus]
MGCICCSVPVPQPHLISNGCVVHQDVKSTIGILDVFRKLVDAVLVINVQLVKFLDSGGTPALIPGRQIHSALKLGTQFLHNGKSNALVSSRHLCHE